MTVQIADPDAGVNLSPEECREISESMIEQIENEDVSRFFRCNFSRESCRAMIESIKWNQSNTERLSARIAIAILLRHGVDAANDFADDLPGR